MENNYINNKLEYIFQLNKKKFASKSVNKEYKETHSEAELDLDYKTNANTIKDCITFYKNKMKSRSNDDLSITKLETFDKKLKILKAYMNLVLLTITMKYMDIIIRVKYGGFIFSFGSIFLFYYSNRKFNQYQNYLLITELADINKTNPKNLLHQYICTKQLQSDEEKLRKVSLKKYWKEPMAWH